MIECFIEENPEDDFLYIELKLDGERVEYWVIPKEFAPSLCDALCQTQTINDLAIGKGYIPDRVHFKNCRNTSTVDHS